MYIELYLNGKKRTKGRKSCHLWWVWWFQWVGLGGWVIGRLGGWAADGGALLPTNRRQLAATIKRFTM